MLFCPCTLPSSPARFCFSHKRLSVCTAVLLLWITSTELFRAFGVGCRLLGSVDPLQSIFVDGIVCFPSAFTIPQNFSIDRVVRSLSFSADLSLFRAGRSLLVALYRRSQPFSLGILLKIYSICGSPAVGSSSFRHDHFAACVVHH